MTSCFCWSLSNILKHLFVSLFLSSQNLVVKKERKKRKNVTVPRLEGLRVDLRFMIEGTSFLGVFLLKKTKHLFVFKFTASFVPAPCLCQNWSSDTWSDACLTPEKLSCVHSPISNDGLLGQLLILGLLESQELQDWICRVNVFPCKSPIHLIHGMPQRRDSALFCKRQKISGSWGT